MNKAKLIESARKVLCARREAITEYASRQETLCALMNEAMLQRKDMPDIIGGEENVSMMKDNHANHLRFIISALTNPDPETLADVVLWVFKSYKSRGFHSSYWSAQINTWITILHQQLSRESLNDILPIYEWMSTNIPIFEMLSQENSPIS
jgi:hypothetical protein